MTVRFALEDGSQGSVTLRRGELYRGDMLLELDAFERSWPAGSRAYRFRRYVSPHED
jgi:hypothetical protein